MDKKKRRQMRVPEPEFELNKEEFYALTDLLFELLKENHSKCARVLGISTQTWRSWETKPPKMPHWNLVLRHVCQTILKSIITHRQSLSKKHRKRLMSSLKRIPDHSSMIDLIEHEAYTESSAMLHLRTLLQHGGMFWDEIRLPGNCGGFNQKTLRTAAARLNVVKTQEGYADKKRSFWRLPTPDD